MSIQIEDDCETAVGCLKGVVVAAYCIFVICVVVYILFKLHNYTHKVISFELIPLSSTICQSLFQFTLNIFIMETKLILSALYFQALTFGIISTSCSQLCLRIKYPQKQNTIKRYTVIAFSIAQLACLVIYVLTLTDIIPLDCNNWFSIAYLFPMMVMGCYTLASICFGSTLIRFIKTKKQENNHLKKVQDELEADHSPQVRLIEKEDAFQGENERAQNSRDFVIESIKKGENDVGFTNQLKKQLRLIEFLFLFTIVLQISMDLIRTYALESYIQCEATTGISNEFQAQSYEGQIFLIFYQFIQITPCLIAPYVFYYVPFKNKRNGQSILLPDNSFNMEDSKVSLNSNKLRSDQYDFGSNVNFSQNNEGRPLKPDLNKIQQQAQRVFEKGNQMRDGVSNSLKSSMEVSNASQNTNKQRNQQIGYSSKDQQDEKQQFPAKNYKNSSDFEQQQSVSNQRVTGPTNYSDNERDTLKEESNKKSDF